MQNLCGSATLPKTENSKGGGEGFAALFRGGKRMLKTAAVMHYKAAVTVFAKWLAEGLISKEEFTEINSMIATKYGISLCSIYRDIA